MRQFFLGLGIAAALFGAVAPAALAESANGDLVLTNGTGTGFESVYIAKNGDREWGDPIFKEEIAPGATHKIVFSGFGEGVCSFSILVRDANGTDWIVDDIDMCATDKVTFKAENGKLKYYAE